jgi:hypothetical protein
MSSQMTPQEVQTRLNAHEDICAVRYEGIEKQMTGVNARLKRIESMYLKIGGGLIVTLIAGYAYLIDTIKQLLGG